ncbi:MAG: UvrD-helicase domain-containing protein [bacterium]|nr:UvrD-helicase domain-containing protein [bacterium]
MPKWTAEQQLAIDKDNTNIIVSAGAGSGKTAVLTSRVIRKLKQGVDINKILILTFTNAAAKEMKERIRNSIKKDETLVRQLDLIDGAYITTFDSFSLSLVKKYHYLLGIEKNINIVDASVMYYENSKVIDEVFEKLYEEKDSDFEKLIYDFCIKDDKEIKKYILNINSKLDLLYDKKDYLDNYISEFYSDDNIGKSIGNFNRLLTAKISTINKNLDTISNYVDIDYLNKINDSFRNLLNSKKYDEIKSNLDIKIPALPRGTEEIAKEIKSNISELIKEMKSICIYENEKDIIDGIMSTECYVKAIIKIINLLDSKLKIFKKENNVYEFNDISKMAISIIEDNKEVREELKYSLNEIMIDEYQDTSDLQEKFISLIENNNTYMVGDVKQSIYRFRNANPYIFKNKYDNYSIGNKGFKIDLVKNFRSRSETLDDINVIFNIIMDDFIGGADYKESHQMVFGNSLYTENNIDTQNNNLEIYNYEYDKESEYNKDEIEAFITAWDIKNKIDNKYQIFDKENMCLRDIKYNDFVILMDRATKFDLYKKIFEYLNIPLIKYTDANITDSNDILIIKNIIGALLKIRDNILDIELKYFLTSIYRSYLFSYTDNEIFSMITKSNFESEAFKILKDISYDLDNLSISRLVSKIIDKFNFYEKLLTIGDIQSSIIRLEYIYNLSVSSESLDYSINDFYNYLSKLINDNIDIKVSMSENSEDSVKIMTIHKSKGLEYPICYYTGLHSTFNVSDTKERILFDKDFGIITPYFKEGICKTIYSHLFKDKYILEEISEKIRLFYVALTRCREKMIIVCALENKSMNSLDERINYKSFLNILNSIYNNLIDYITNIDLNKILITKDYDLIKKVNYKENIKNSNKKIEKVNLNIETSIIENSRYSKNEKQLFTKKEKNNIKLGTLLHNYLEEIDFNNPDLSLIPKKYVHFIQKFIDCGLNFSNCNIYKELEFVYNVDSKNRHGIIDLMLEYNDHIKIIDYKLNNIKDSAYLEQLNGYREYVKSKIDDKPVKIYLYSIIEGFLEEL